MIKSYALTRPEDPVVETKRPRRRYIQPSTSNETYEFSYKCYQCGSPYTVALSSNTEIECPTCSSRIICKESSKKPHILDAV
jgi:DNA-directed RNA polymerase subunit RPC12/RpoP